MKKFILASIAVVAIAAHSGCVASIPTRIKNQQTLAPSSGTLTAPVATTVKLAEGVETDAIENLQAMVEGKIGEAFKKAKIAVSSGSSNKVEITITRVQAMGVGKRMLVGNFGPSDEIDALVQWSDGSSIKLTGRTGLVRYGYIPFTHSHLVEATEKLAETIAAETQARLQRSGD